jgi:AraC family transcriptional regulator
VSPPRSGAITPVRHARSLIKHARTRFVRMAMQRLIAQAVDKQVFGVISGRIRNNSGVLSCISEHPGSKSWPSPIKEMAMQLKSIWVDRGEAQDKLGQEDPTTCWNIAAISRSASLGIGDNQGSFWLVLRGGAQVDCREGRLLLKAGDWIALDRDSKPTLLAGRRALALAFVLPSSGSSALDQAGMPTIYPGRGSMSRRNMRLALHLWRRAAGFHGRTATVEGTDPVVTVRCVMHFLSSLQEELVPFVDRCPGRSQWRKRQVFARMQRARLYLDGNLNRAVPLSELAQLSNFSIWYFTKTFHAIYLEGPRDMMSRTRLRQASMLLEKTSLSVGEVGAACGFENPCSFARAFRAHYGTTASGYRDVQRCA